MVGEILGRFWETPSYQQSPIVVCFPVKVVFCDNCPSQFSAVKTMVRRRNMWMDPKDLMEISCFSCEDSKECRWEAEEAALCAECVGSSGNMKDQSHPSHHMS